MKGEGDNCGGARSRGRDRRIPFRHGGVNVAGMAARSGPRRRLSAPWKERRAGGTPTAGAADPHAVASGAKSRRRFRTHTRRRLCSGHTTRACSERGAPRNAQPRQWQRGSRGSGRGRPRRRVTAHSRRPALNQHAHTCCLCMFVRWRRQRATLWKKGKTSKAMFYFDAKRERERTQRETWWALYRAGSVLCRVLHMRKRGATEASAARDKGEKRQGRGEEDSRSGKCGAPTQECSGPRRAAASRADPRILTPHNASTQSHRRKGQKREEEKRAAAQSRSSQPLK